MTISTDTPPAPAPEGRLAADAGPPVRPLIDGQPVEGSGPRLTLVDPATGAPAGVLTTAGAAGVDRAADSAAFNSALWRGTPIAERSAALERLALLVHEHAWRIAELVCREQGKPRHEALALEVLPALDHLRFLIDHAQRYDAGIVLDPRHPFYAHKRAQYLYDPLGVVALITSSSLPFALPLIQIAAALAMGNAVVLKPSQRTPRSALCVGELCLRAGIPPGLVNVVPGLAEDGLRLAAHPRVDKVFVTGSLEAGQAVMATAGCAPRPVVLALGGKHPAVVAGDADVLRAARGIVWGALANSGQNCGAIERVFVEERIASRFLKHVLDEVDRLRVGRPLDEEVDLGPLVSAERRDTVHRHVTGAVELGARLLRGGTIPEGPGFYYPPTVVLGPPTDCALMQEETLGPVIPIVVTESLERAILLANESHYALTASGWTTDETTAERLMVALQAGVVTINDVLYSFGEPAASWSGYRKSGIGHNHGTAGLREMCRQRFVSWDATTREAPLFAFPYDGEARRMADAALTYLQGRSWFTRLRAFTRLCSMPRFRNRVPARSALLPPRRHRR